MSKSPSGSPSRSQLHQKQWAHNRALVSSIPATHPDWVVTVAFYATLHAIDALLAHDGVTVISHDSRNSVLQKTNRYEKIWKHYHPLYNLSRTVRYLANPSKWMPFEQIDEQVLRRNVYPAERSVQKLLGLTVDLAEIALTAKPGPAGT